MHDHQSVFLVPGSFSSNVNSKCNADCYIDMITEDIKKYVEWAQSDDKVSGVFPWTWGSCPGCTNTKDEIGTEKLPQLQSAWTSAFGKL